MDRHTLRVTKRNGTKVPIRFDEITDRLTALCELEPKIDISINPLEITRIILDRVNDGISTTEIDNLVAETCVNILKHPDYRKLGTRVIISNHHKHLATNYGTSFSDVVFALCKENKDPNGEISPVLSEEMLELVNKHKIELDEMIDLNRDYDFDFFGFKTLQKSYLLKINNPKGSIIVESPQHMYLRLSLAIHKSNLEKVKETYDLLSTKKFTHATPSLYNAGLNNQQLFSCFIMNVDDSVKGIFKMVLDCALISKMAGGIGISISDIRGRDSYVRSTCGKSDGIPKMLEVLNTTARYINQGSRRNGSFAVYLEPWHIDIKDFIKSKHPQHGKANDLFYGLWIPDLFMEAVKDNKDWYLMCPDECPRLTETYGAEFNELYNYYVENKKYRIKVKAKEIWDLIIDSQIETGVPYMLYKDACNEKSNHKNIGTIKSSNLCTEILEYNDTEKYACCVLASIILPSYVEEYELDSNATFVDKFDYDELARVTKIVTRNLDKLIDYNTYPVPQTELSNFSERPIGIGVQGLADVFFKMKIAYDSPEAVMMNKKIFETIYFAAMSESCQLAKECGTTYKTYEGSPISKGIFQFNMWSTVNESELMHPWEQLRQDIKKYGVKNSLVTALMPTASTAQISGSTESFECTTSNIYTRRVLAGEFIVLNKYLVNDLTKLGIWSEKIKNKLTKYRGSVQKIDEIPDYIKNIYKTCWEIKQKVVIDLSADRAPFIDQSQSLNLWFEKPEYDKLTSAHFYAYKMGLKTGSYYIRSMPQLKTETIDNEIEDNCEMCSA